MVPAPTCHMIASTILLDVLFASRTLLNLDTHDFLHIADRHRAWVFWKPLVVAHKTHDGVESHIAQAPTGCVWAINLHGFWVEWVRLKRETPLNLFVEVIQVFGLRTKILPHMWINGAFAARAETWNSRSTRTQHLTANGRTFEPRLDPTRPALLARSMYAGGSHKCSNTGLQTHGACSEKTAAAHLRVGQLVSDAFQLCRKHCQLQRHGTPTLRNIAQGFPATTTKALPPNNVARCKACFWIVQHCNILS